MTPLLATSGSCDFQEPWKGQEEAVDTRQRWRLLEALFSGTSLNHEGAFSCTEGSVEFRVCSRNSWSLTSRAIPPACEGVHERVRAGRTPLWAGTASAMLASSSSLPCVNLSFVAIPRGAPSPGCAWATCLDIMQLRKLFVDVGLSWVLGGTQTSPREPGLG